MRFYFFRALGVWLAIIAAESVHGALRVAFLEPVLGSFRARQVSVLTASVIILAITWATSHWVGAPSPNRRALLGIGAAWVALTLCFEVVLGRMVMNASWERIFEDYNVARGGLMPFGLTAMFLAPLLVSTWREGRSRAYLAPGPRRPAPATASRVTASQLNRMN